MTDEEKAAEKKAKQAAYDKAYREANRDRRNAAVRAHRAANREEVRAKAREYRQRPEVKARRREECKRYYHRTKHREAAKDSTMVRWMRQSAKERGIAFDLTLEDYTQLLEASGMRCALSGVELTREVGSQYRVSIDRIDSNLGYIKGNLQVVAACMNYAKNNMSQEEFIAMCKAVAAKHSDESRSVINSSQEPDSAAA